jgi:hypothetical protein
LALWAGALYVVVAIQVLRQRKPAFGLLIAALALSAGQWIHELDNPLFTEAYSVGHITRDAVDLCRNGIACGSAGLAA